MLCVVCMDAPAGRPAAGGPEYTCPPGCRGRHAVCEECSERLFRCVYCRSPVGRDAGDAGWHLELIALLLMAVTWAAVCASLAIKQHAPADARSGEDAFGNRVAWDVEAPD